MKNLDRLRHLSRRRHQCPTCESPVIAVEARARWRTRLSIAQEAWMVAMAQRLCVEMPMLIDSLPNEMLHASLTGRGEARDD